MLYSVVLTLVCLLALVLGIRNLGKFPISLDEIRLEIEATFATPFSGKSWIWFLFLISFFLLPFFWGLTFFLKSDANVLVIILGLFWIYFWSRTLILFR
ncbi:LIC10362 family protein [Leptospira licerasiae]|uniref:Uncharacterized protein n=1 Tax=Leptospira licerasiae str. MMD4847 TaxID=1049971 RepID=A0ABN0H5D9_9LEPT|nr:hypothetical protein [Leptospira licerasiae]EIE02785.1 hypothetical protein LEP1GSC185_1667 [Leptospira licerasiae serovar Varillal str. VAR 010]EJZ40752.1 hypothetical protein LEP1GSC178_0929 [Leptospira licerasiae str. MMD4847]TGM90240.1 hypothetical protein EHR05_05415 [Leptospira licerasiae]